MQLQGLTLNLRHIVVHMSAMHAHSAAGPTKLLCRSGLWVCSLREKYVKSYCSIFRCYLAKCVQLWTN
jgi:hypothetical protein